MNIDTSVMLADDLDDEPKPLAAAPRPSLTNLPPPPKRRSSIKDRFEDAKKEQQRVEEERLGKFKHKDVISPKGNVAGMWNSALANSKTNEAERYQAKRRETISQFQTAEAAGIVADRVKHFEELYMQLAASIEKMEATIRAARRNAKKWKMAATSPMRAAKGGPPGAVEEAPGIRIRLGETATFWFDPQYFSYVNAMLAKNRNDPISLPTGVYSDQAAPHIDVVAVCILDTSSNEPYLAITVDYCDGQAGDLLALGQKKIAVFATDHLKGETGVDDLVQVFSEAFVILSREDTGVSAFEMMEEEDEIVEDELAQLSEGLKNSIVDDFNAQDFPQVETAEIDATVGDSLEGKGEEIVLSNSQCAEHCSDEEIDKTLADDNLDSVEKQSDDCLNITLVDSTVDTSIRDENEEEFYAYDAIQEIQVDSATGDELPVAHSAQIQTEVEISPEQYPTEEDSSIGQAMPEAGEVVEIGSPMHRNDSTENVNEVASTPNFHNKDNETSSDDNVTPTSYVSTAHSVSEVDDFIPVDLKSPLSTKNRLKSSSNVKHYD